MDFLEFLKNSTSQNSTNESKNKQKREKKTTTNININTNNNSNPFNTNNTNNNSNLFNTIDTYKTIKKNDFVKIIYNPNSPLNCYKGYIGEIKNYRTDQDYALIFLHAINSPQLIRFPLTHFQLYDYK